MDTLLDELVKCQNLDIALAVPINSSDFQKCETERITLFGLPNPKETNFLKKTLARIAQSQENLSVNRFASQAISDFNPDIIQVFGSENPFGLIAEKIKTPVIIHIQGYLLVWQGKWFKGISKWEQFRYTGLKNLLLMRGSYNDYFTFRKRAKTEAIIIKNCKYFMGRTNFDKRIVSLISPGSKYFHCEEFIRKDIFRKTMGFTIQNEITCVSILKGTSYKGIDLLVRSLIDLKKVFCFII